MKHSYGKVTREADGFMVRFERLLPHPIEKVWDAITKPENLRIWFTEIEMDFVPGGKMIIHFDDEAKTISYGKIIKIQRPHIFQFTWEDELATWELFEEEKSQCKLILTYSRLPESYAAQVPAGWHVLLDQLETVLDGRTEPYPFGSEEGTPESRHFKSVYAELVYTDFPGLKPND